MTRTAEYSGHCQACGHPQKLPTGLLSLHGYKVTSGYFSGTCTGARELPFEQSCDLVKRFIASATAQLASIEGFQAELRRPATATQAFMYVRYETTRTTRTYGMTRSIKAHAHRWEQVELQQVFKSFSDGSKGGYYVYSFVAQDGTLHGGTGRDSVSGKQDYDLKVENPTALDCLLATCTDYNAKYATWLEHEADSLRRYIAWQTERVRTWKSAPLFPVTHKDKVGFEPTPARY